MNGLYVVIDNEIFLHNDAISLCPMLSRLEQPVIKYIVAVYDYTDSPLRGQPISRRKELAASLFFKEEKEKRSLILSMEADEDIRMGIEELKSIVFDIDAHSYDVQIEKIDQLNIDLAQAKSYNDIKNIQMSINLCRTSADELKKKIEQRDANMINVQLKGGRSLSFLERWQRNRAYYDRLHRRTEAK